MDAYSLWLLPGQPWADRLEGLNRRLAPWFGHPPFVPHVTVVGDLAVEPGRLGALARRLAETRRALVWGRPEVGQSAFYFRTLYLRWADAPGFEDLADAAEAGLGPSPGRSPFAHLSLAYGRPADLAPDADLVQAVEARFPGSLSEGAGGVVFDRLAVVLSAKDVPLDRWKVVDEAYFRANAYLP